MRSLPSTLVAALLLAAVPAPAQQPSSDVGMGVFPFLVGNMDGRITQICDDCVNHGVDTIYVSVFRARGPQTGELWITDRSGNWNPGWGQVRRNGAGIDLTQLVQAAHARDLRVVAVLKCFDDSVQPTDAAHRQYLLDVVGYLVNSFHASGEPVYDVDGLALDYVRFVGSGTGNDPRFVTDFVRDVKARIGALSLHAYLLANRYTFDGPSYDGNFASYAAVVQSLASQFGQHWEQMARHVDVMMPMCYTADGSIYSTYALHQAYVRQAAAYCRVACNRAGFALRRVQPVVKTYQSSGETTTPQTVDASVTGALLGGADGYQAFRYGTMHSSWWPVLAQWAVPGPNFPLPRALGLATGVTARLDPSPSRDGDEPSSGLTARFDWGDDGAFDTAWLPLAPDSHVFGSPAGGRVGLQVRDSDGHVSATRRQLRGSSVLALSAGVVSAGLGGRIDLSIDAGDAAAGATYIVLGTLSGTAPGTAWTPELQLPLNLDSLSEALMLAVNTPLLPNALGTLDLQGRATASFVVPAGLLQPLVFRTISWSLAAVDPSGTPWFVGDARAVLVLS